MANVLSRGGKVEAALIELQRAATAEEVWPACVKLMRAALPAYHILIGLPSLGITTRSRLAPLYQVLKPR